MNLVDFAMVAASPLACIFCGILKEYAQENMARPALRFGAPSASAMWVLYVLEGILSSLADPSSIWYIVLLAVLFAVLWFLFYRLVDLGQHIVHNEDEDSHHHTDYAMQKTHDVMMPVLDKFVSNTKSNISADLNSELSKMCTLIAGLSQNIQLTATQLQSIKNSHEDLSYNYEYLTKDLTNIISKSQSQHDETSRTIQEQSEIISKQSELISIMSAKLEALFSDKNSDENAQKDDKNTCDTAQNASEEQQQKTILTAQDGMSSRAIGNKMQGLMAQYLREYGFDVEEGYGAGSPDYILRKSGTIVAIGSNKSYTLKEQPGRMQRSISIKDVAPELILAKKLNMQLVVFVTNITNGRRWAKKIPSDMLESWNGEPTPVILAKNDPESGKILEESFLLVLADLGADV